MLKSLCSKNEKYRPNLNFRNSTYFSWKCVPLEIQNTILTPMLEILCPKSKKISLKLRKKNRRTIFQKRYFAQKCPLDIYYALLITLPRTFLRIWEFFAHNPTKLHIFPQKTCFSTKCCAGFYNAILKIQPKFWLTIAWNFFAENPNLSAKSIWFF